MLIFVLCMVMFFYSAFSRVALVLLAICCRLFICPIQAIEVFRNVLTPFGTLAICWHPSKIPRETSPSGELNARGVAIYSNFAPIERYISEMVQDPASTDDQTRSRTGVQSDTVSTGLL